MLHSRTTFVRIRFRGLIQIIYKKNIFKSKFFRLSLTSNWEFVLIKFRLFCFIHNILFPTQSLLVILYFKKMSIKKIFNLFDFFSSSFDIFWSDPDDFIISGSDQKCSDSAGSATLVKHWVTWLGLVYEAVEGNAAPLIIEHLVVAHRPVICTGEVLGQTLLAVGWDAAQAGHPELLGNPF